MCWPSAAQEKLLRACFLSGPAATREFNAWRRELPIDQIDDVSLRLLPILAHSWGDDPGDGEIGELGSRIRLAQWQQNRQRIALAASLHKTLSAAGIPCMFLKGMALLSRFYAGTGLRAMGDVDFLVPRSGVMRATEVLTTAGWIAEDNLASQETTGQMRVRHAWQFSRGPEENCDLHWHPVVRCYNPGVADAFWNGAESVNIGAERALVPCPTDQLFHVCAHGLQWSWTPQTRWISDAMTIFASGESASGELIDWHRLYELAAAARMTFRIHAALRYLRERMEAPVQENALGLLAGHRTAPAPSWNTDAWERSEYDLLQKRCPLGAVDRVRWHITNFQRIRPYDDAWKNKRAALGFLEYLGVFLRTGGTGEIVTSLWRALKSRSTN